MPSVPRRIRRIAILAAAVAAALIGTSAPRDARANERHFTFTYETATLPAGAREIEVWTTPRIGRDDFFVEFDQRLEFEVGITDRVLTSFYLNASAVTADVAPDTRESVTSFDGVSNEWKVKLSDPVADPLGVALYGELSAGPTASELEGKVIVDRYLGNLLLAGNLVAAQEWEYDTTETESEQEVEIDLGATYFVHPGVAVGLEVRNHNQVAEGDWESSALYAGPVVSYATDDWWVALTIQPQLPALKNAPGSSGDSRVLLDQEKLDARLLFSFHL